MHTFITLPFALCVTTFLPVRLGYPLSVPPPTRFTFAFPFVTFTRSRCRTGWLTHYIYSEGHPPITGLIIYVPLDATFGHCWVLPTFITHNRLFWRFVRGKRLPLRSALDVHPPLDYRSPTHFLLPGYTCTRSAVGWLFLLPDYGHHPACTHMRFCAVLDWTPTAHHTGLLGWTCRTVTFGSRCSSYSPRSHICHAGFPVPRCGSPTRFLCSV